MFMMPINCVGECRYNVNNSFFMMCVCVCVSISGGEGIKYSEPKSGNTAV